MLWVTGSLRTLDCGRHVWCMRISLLKPAFITHGVKVAIVIRSAEHTIRKENQTNGTSNKHCDWFILRLLLVTQTIWFSLHRKRRWKEMATFWILRLCFICHLLLIFTRSWVLSRLLNMTDSLSLSSEILRFLIRIINAVLPEEIEQDGYEQIHRKVRQTGPNTWQPCSALKDPHSVHQAGSGVKSH